MDVRRPVQAEEWWSTRDRANQTRRVYLREQGRIENEQGKRLCRRMLSIKLTEPLRIDTAILRCDDKTVHPRMALSRTRTSQSGHDGVFSGVRIRIDDGSEWIVVWKRGAHERDGRDRVGVGRPFRDEPRVFERLSCSSQWSRQHSVRFPQSDEQGGHAQQLIRKRGSGFNSLRKKSMATSLTPRLCGTDMSTCRLRIRNASGSDSVSSNGVWFVRQHQRTTPMDQASTMEL